jgi:hypothetical protein
VLPQKPAAGSKWLAWFPNANGRYQWVHKLGNIALLTRKKNSAASNYEFDKKKQSYFAQDGVSPSVLTTQVLDKNEWTPIRPRGTAATAYYAPRKLLAAQKQEKPSRRDRHNHRAPCTSGQTR